MELPPDALSDGLNLCIEPDGLLQPRKGMTRLEAQLPVGGQRIMAGVGYRDVNGQPQIVVSTLTNQYALIGQAWQDITGPTQTSAVYDVSVRLVPFAQVNGQSLLYMIDGTDHDNIRVWFSVAGTLMQEVVNQNFNANALRTFAAADMAVVGDRLVVIATNEVAGDAPGRHAQRVRWSSVLDGQNWPIGAWNELPGVGNLIAIRQSSRTTAIVYGETGAYIMTAQLGSDAGAFSFDRINDVIVPPHCPTALVERGGRHWYVSEDLNIWVCDGQNARIFSEGIHAGLSDRLVTGTDQRPVAMYDEIRERVIFFVATKTPFGDLPGDSTKHEAMSAIAWNERLGCWEPPWHFPEGITAAFGVTEMLGVTWDSVPIAVTWDNVDALYSSWDSIPTDTEMAIYIGTHNGFINRFWTSTTDTPPQAIPYFATWGLRSVGQSDRLEVNMIEVFLQPITPNGDTIRMQLFGLSTPYDPAPVTLFDALVDEGDITTWLQRLGTTVAVSAFRPANYMRFVLTGNSADGGPVFAGGTLYCFPSKRGDPLQGLSASTVTP